MVKAYLEQIKKEDEKVHAIITVCEEEALEEAKKVQELFDQGEKLGPMAGIPIVIKDN